MLKLFLQIDHIFISRRNAQDIWKGILHQEILMDHGHASGVYFSVLWRKNQQGFLYLVDGQYKVPKCLWMVIYQL